MSAMEIVNRRGTGDRDRRGIGDPGDADFDGVVRVVEGVARNRPNHPISAFSTRAQPRCLKRQLSLPVSMMSQWWVSRSSSAVVILASPKTAGHSPKARLVVTMTEVRS